MLCNGRTMTDADIIRDLGGPTKVAQLLGYEKYGPQRVQNWLVRGIPAHVKVERPDLFMVGQLNAASAESEG